MKISSNRHRLKLGQIVLPKNLLSRRLLCVAVLKVNAVVVKHKVKNIINPAVIVTLVVVADVDVRIAAVTKVHAVKKNVMVI